MKKENQQKKTRLVRVDVNSALRASRKYFKTKKGKAALQRAQDRYNAKQRLKRKLAREQRAKEKSCV